MGDLDDLAAAAQQKAKSPASPVVRYGPSGSGNIFAQWRRWSGVRSFIFQLVLIGWTFLFCFLAMGSLFITAGSSQPTNIYETQQDAQRASAGIFAGSLCCLGGVWALIAVPVAIAAVATFKTAD
jgi:uncharacterized membrane protein